jgi:acyl carrier protein
MFEDVKKMLVEDLSVAEGRIVPEAELVNDLGINSLELADLIMICEDKYGVTVDDDDIHRFITVGDIVDYLEEKKG